MRYIYTDTADTAYLKRLLFGAVVGLDGHVGKRATTGGDRSIDGVERYRVRDVLWLWVLRAHGCVLAGLRERVVARIEIFTLVAEEVLGKDGQVAVLLLELGRLFCERHIHVVATVAQVLIALALH